MPAQPNHPRSPSPQPRLAGVVFDLYGTLVDGGFAERDAVAHAMAHDLGVDPAAFAAAIRETFEERVRGRTGSLQDTVRMLAERVGGAPAPAAVEAAAERRLALTRRLLEADKTTLGVLDRLRAAGLALGLVSDCSNETPTAWAVSPLASRFQGVAFSCLLGVRKPEPAIYLHTLGQLQLAPAACVFVGDGESHELTGAAALGMRAVRVRPLGAAAADRHEDDVGFAGDEIGSLTELLVLPEVAARIGGAGD
jgi:putative hydrolase of the HAD superfamily